MNELLPGVYHAQNVHPLFVHFPIALWSTALLFLGLGALRRQEELFRVGRWLVYLGLLGAAVALGTGLWAENDLGHDSPGHELVHVHRDWMFATSAAGAAVAALAFALRHGSGNARRWAVTIAMLATVCVMTVGADRGGELVFRYGVGTRRDAWHPQDGHGEHGGMEPTETPEHDPAHGDHVH